MGRKPRLLSCSASWPHRRHERLPSTQNSCIRNEGKLLLLLKLLDAFLSFLALCYCNTSKTIQASFLCVSFGNVGEERMCSCLCACTVCLCASMFVCLWLIALIYCLQLWYCPAMLSDRHTHTHSLLSLDCASCKNLGTHLSFPSHTFWPPAYLSSRLHPAAAPSGPHQSPDPHFLSHLRNFPGCYSCVFCQDSTLCPQSTPLPSMCVCVCVCVCVCEALNILHPVEYTHCKKSCHPNLKAPYTLLKPEWPSTDS